MSNEQMTNNKAKYIYVYIYTCSYVYVVWSALIFCFNRPTDRSFALRSLLDPRVRAAIIKCLMWRLKSTYSASKRQPQTTKPTTTYNNIYIHMNSYSATYVCEESQQFEAVDISALTLKQLAHSLSAVACVLANSPLPLTVMMTQNGVSHVKMTDCLLRQRCVECVGRV